MQNIAAAAALALIALASAAHAQHSAPYNDSISNAINYRQGAVFYNKPGVTQANYRRDRRECDLVWQDLTVLEGTGGDFDGSPSPVPLRVGNSREHIDNCMRTRGYRRFFASGQDQQALDEQIEDEATFDALISAERPSRGVFSAAWGNPWHLGSASDPRGWSIPMLTTARTRRALQNDPLEFEEFRHLGRRAQIDARPNEAVIVTSTRFSAEGIGKIRFVWSYIDPVTHEYGLTRIRRHNLERSPYFYVETSGSDVGGTSHVDEPRYQAYIVPAGVYALETLISRRGNNEFSFTSFCLGTIAFEAQGGDVLYVGDTLATAPDRDYLSVFRIDQTDLESARAQLQRAPDIATRLRPATLFNGFSLPCSGGTESQTIASYALPGAATWEEPQAVQ